MFEKYLPLDQISASGRDLPSMERAAPRFSELGFVVVENSIADGYPLELRNRGEHLPGVNKALLRGILTAPKRLAACLPGNELLQLPTDDQAELVSKNRLTTKRMRVDYPKEQSFLGIIVATSAQDCKISRPDQAFSRSVAFCMPRNSMLILQSEAEQHHRVYTRTRPRASGHTATVVTYSR